jgi:hypothetical protein
MLKLIPHCFGAWDTPGRCVNGNEQVACVPAKYKNTSATTRHIPARGRAAWPRARPCFAELEAALANHRGPGSNAQRHRRQSLFSRRNYKPLMMRTRRTRIFCPDCVSGCASLATSASGCLRSTTSRSCTAVGKRLDRAPTEVFRISGPASSARRCSLGKLGNKFGHFGF